MKKTGILAFFLALLFLLPPLSAGAVFYPEKNCDLLILLYHDLVEEETSASSNPLYATTPRKFEEDLKVLLSSGRLPLSLEDYASGCYRAGGRYFAVTFDDGYLSNYRFAYPVLKKYGIPGAVFAVVSTVGRSNHFKYYQADEMNDLVKVYSHSFGHLDLASLDSEELKKDLTLSFETLEKKLASPGGRFLAYPGGSYSVETVGVARACGAALQFVQDGSLLTASDLLTRVMVYYGSDMRKIVETHDFSRPVSLRLLRPESAAGAKGRIGAI